MPHILPLDDETWQRLLAMGEASTSAAGNQLIDKTTRLKSLYVVTRGSVEVVLPDESRLILRAPTIVGELSALSGHMPAADVFAHTEVNVLQVATNDLWALAQHDEVAFRALFEQLSALAHQRLQGNYHPRPYIALVAHDGRKDELIAVAAQNRSYLRGQILLSTHNSAALLAGELELPIHRRVNSGLLGGDQEIGALVAASQVKAMVFFQDPLAPHAHLSDVQALLRLCDVKNVPVATNPSTAHLLFASLAREQVEL